MSTFKALMLEETDGKVSASFQDVDEARLPEGDVTVAVKYSTTNYNYFLIFKHSFKFQFIAFSFHLLKIFNLLPLII